MNIRELAAQYLTYFEQITRDDGSKPWVLKDHNNTPEPLMDLIREAHGDIFPDDFVYEFITDALGMIADADEDTDLDELDSDIEADVYNSDLLRWLSSHLERVGYVEEYVQEFAGKIEGKDFNLYNLIGSGQWLEKTEVYRSVLSSLRDIYDALEDEEYYYTRDENVDPDDDNED